MWLVPVSLDGSHNNVCASWTSHANACFDGSFPHVSASLCVSNYSVSQFDPRFLEAIRKYANGPREALGPIPDVFKLIKDAPDSFTRSSTLFI
jgi:hypothetical protein